MKVPTNQNTNTTFYKTKNKILLPSLEKKQSPMSKTSIMFNKKKDIESLLNQIDIDSEINLKMFKIESTLGKGYPIYSDPTLKWTNLDQSTTLTKFLQLRPMI